MPRTLPSPAARKASATAQLVNRRATIRYPCEGGTAELANRRLSRYQKVRVHDISEGGIALLLKRPPQVGDWVFLQLTNRILQFSYDMVGEVRHVRPGRRGKWIVGLQFDDPLSPAELAALL